MFKKIALAVTALVILAGGFLVIYQSLPQKKHARHLVKARFFVKEKNYIAALREYEKAYDAVGTFTPWSSIEVLELVNGLKIQERDIKTPIENTRKYLQENPTSTAGRFIMASLALQGGEMEAGFEALNSLLQSNPDNFQARHLLAQIRSRQGRLDLAEEQLRLMAAAHPESLQTILPLAENLLRQGKAFESRDLLLKITSKGKGQVGAWQLLVDSYLVEGKADSARLALDMWMARDSSSKMAATFRRARLHALAGKMDSAFAVLAPFKERSKDNVPAFQEMAMLYAQKGQFDSAVFLYDAIAELQPSASGSMAMIKCYLHMADQNPARALETLKRLQITVSDNSLAGQTIATYLALGQEHKALELIAGAPDSLKPTLRYMVEQLPADREFMGLWSLANYFLAHHKRGMAVTTLGNLHRKFPSNAYAAAAYASQLAGMGVHADALKILNTLKSPTVPQQMQMIDLNIKLRNGPKAKALAEGLLRKDPSLRGLNTVLADISHSQGDKQKWLTHMEKELTLDSNNVICLNNMAWELGVGQRNPEKAAPYLARLEKLKTFDPRVLDTIGWILALAGKHKEAEGYLSLATNLVPDSPTLLYHLGWVKLKSGAEKAGRDLIEKSIKSGIPFPEKDEAVALLKD